MSSATRLLISICLIASAANAACHNSEAPGAETPASVEATPTIEGTPGTPGPVRENANRPLTAEENARVEICRRGQVAEHAPPASVTEERWRMGTTAYGPDRQTYWFADANDPNACACAGCAPEHCISLQSAPAQASCVGPR